MNIFEYKTDTHTVLKHDDVNHALTAPEVDQLDALLMKVVNYRKSLGKNPRPTYYVVNTDEPYADLIIQVIMFGESNK